MEPFKVITSKTIVLPQKDIDTDQIIPARFLTVTDKNGLGDHLFHDWRYNEDGSQKEDFILNSINPNDFKILVGGHNFGCGSSREHAPWALHDYGFRVVISTQIADIFKNNALKNGVLPVVVDQETHDYLIKNPGCEMIVDLTDNKITLDNQKTISFDVEAFARLCMLEGVDQLGFLTKHEDKTETFEKGRPAWI